MNSVRRSTRNSRTAMGNMRANAPSATSAMPLNSEGYRQRAVSTANAGSAPTPQVAPKRRYRSTGLWMGAGPVVGLPPESAIRPARCGEPPRGAILVGGPLRRAAVRM